MLSFDITDKSIKIIKGYEQHGKISITAAAALDIEENIIINGHVVDVPRLANLLNSVIKSNNMKDKDAVVSFSSNLTVFKELRIPGAKNQEFTKMVRAEMQTAMGIDNTYSISYVIVGAEEEKGNTAENTDESAENEQKKPKAKDKVYKVYKVLATACPYEIVESYKQLFSMVSVNLKSVIIGCNSISSVILSDVKSRLKMPLLAVQVDKNFLNLNLYDNNHLAFSRFTSIDPHDYIEDYVTEAVNENIFRMTQFQKTISGNSQIENVLFYGDYDEMEKLIESTAQLDLNARVMSAPALIKGNEKLNFSAYANAIGALYKRDKNTEKINLLETDTIHKSSAIKSDKGFTSILVVALGLTVVIIGGIWISLDLYNKGIVHQTELVNEELEAPKTSESLARYNSLIAQEEFVNRYRDAIKKAKDAFDTKPVLSKYYYDLIENAVAEASSYLGLTSKIEKLDYSNFTFTLEVVCDADADPSQTLPSVIAQKLTACEDFVDVEYTGYEVSEVTDELGNVTKKVKVMTMDIQLDDIEPETESTEPSGEEQSTEKGDAAE